MVIRIDGHRERERGKKVAAIKLKRKGEERKMMKMYLCCM